MRHAHTQHVSRTRDSFGWRTLGSRPQDFGIRRDAAHRHYAQMRAGHFHHEGPCSAPERRPVNRINPYGLPLHPIYEAHEYVNRRHPVEQFGFQARTWGTAHNASRPTNIEWRGILPIQLDPPDRQ